MSHRLHSARRLLPIAFVVPSLSSITAVTSHAAADDAPTATTTATTATLAPKTVSEVVEFTKLPTKVGGLTADKAAASALATSKTSLVDDAKLAAAAAQVDAAWDAYLPKLTGTARYTRLSKIDAPILSLGPTSFSFPVVLDNYVAQASLLIPLSDYALRIYHAHEAAIANAEALTWSKKVDEAQTAADARITFYNLLRARGGVVIADAAVLQAKSHLAELQAKLAQKDATTADVDRILAQLAGAELARIRAENLVTVLETNLRVQLHLLPTAAIEVGEDLEAEVPKTMVDPLSLTAKAFAQRPELRAIETQIAASEQNVTIAGAGMYPRLDAIGNLFYAKPNSRFVPTVDEWRTTWDVSLQLSWSPTDALIASDQKKVASANVSVLKATKLQLEDALSLDVTNAYTRLREAEAAVFAAAAERTAAESAYRVRSQQFQSGLTTSALLVDAESDVTRARLNELNARADVRVAGVLLKKATGTL